MKSNFNFYYPLILCNILESYHRENALKYHLDGQKWWFYSFYMSGRLSKFVCQVPQISGRFPSPLAWFSRICQITFCGNCHSWLSKRYFIRLLRIHIFLTPLCNYLLLMAVSLETNQRILFCSDTHEDHEKVQWKKSCCIKIGTYQSKKC